MVYLNINVDVNGNILVFFKYIDKSKNSYVFWIIRQGFAMACQLVCSDGRIFDESAKENNFF
jgi:hypothetical protein